MKNYSISLLSCSACLLIAPMSLAATGGTNTLDPEFVSRVAAAMQLESGKPSGLTISKWFDVEGGTVLLRQFSLEAKTNGNFTANFDESDVRGMVQGVFRTRKAWRDDFDRAATLATNQWRGFRSLADMDFEARAGFAFGGSGSQSSATIGSGDAFGEATMGMNLLVVSSGPTNPLYTLNLEAFGSFVSDNEFSLIHPAYGAGLGFVAGVPRSADFFERGSQKYEFLVSLGYARVDSPVFVSGSADVEGNSRGEPRYLMNNAIHFCIEARLPIIKFAKSRQYGYLTFGGTFYKFFDNDQLPDQWSLHVGLSLPVESLLDLIPGVH